MLKAAARIVPPLLPKFHKGQLGRILVVGGSEDYTGAPFFAAMATALVGADMSHILCSQGAATVIKTYSPNLMVHPYLQDSSSGASMDSDITGKVGPLLDRMHVVLLGPGLGRDERMLKQAAQVVQLAKERDLPLVVDADGLFLLQQRPELVKDYPNHRVVITPNVVEFGRLLRAVQIGDAPVHDQAKELASKLGCVVLVKGETDLISNGEIIVEGQTEGSPRRVSGQGDTLSGSLATFVGWTTAYKANLWDTEPIPSDAPQDLLVLAAWAASSVTRTASRIAFSENGRATVTTDVNGSVGRAFAELFG